MRLQWPAMYGQGCSSVFTVNVHDKGATKPPTQSAISSVSPAISMTAIIGSYSPCRYAFRFRPRFRVSRAQGRRPGYSQKLRQRPENAQRDGPSLRLRCSVSRSSSKGFSSLLTLLTDPRAGFCLMRWFVQEKTGDFSEVRHTGTMIYLLAKPPRVIHGALHSIGPPARRSGERKKAPGFWRSYRIRPPLLPIARPPRRRRERFLIPWSVFLSCG